jgi:hypothetical protein
MADQIMGLFCCAWRSSSARGAHWLKEARFREVVEEAWGDSEYLNESLAGRLANVHEKLYCWN